MGRTGQLREVAKKQFARIKTGSHQKRTYRKNTVFRFIDTLYACGTVPPSWYGLNKEHISNAVTYWRKKPITDDSIRIYLAEIRYFLQTIDHQLSGIDNKSLGLNRTAEVKRKKFHDDCLQKISDPIIGLIIRLQTEFGLTLSEAFRFTPDLHARTKYLLLSRDMAHNSADRVIDIYSNSQKQLLELADSIIEMNSNPVKQYGYDSLRGRYRVEIKRVGLTPSVNYRYIFAQNRFAYLCKDMKKADARGLILLEMGVSERALRRYLNE
ncbi:hypothetical protein [Legionella fairfieldensis]|uniref:hypothetical protein n=1 Tax=Legionella fairfieldensis TaxID=45064 RepID=UPI00048FF080|nr:hypothetical protein [Legionella fairfieldensis]